MEIDKGPTVFGQLSILNFNFLKNARIYKMLL